MLKIYIGKLDKPSNLPLLLPNLGLHIKDKWLFIKKAFSHYTKPVLEIVDDPEVCDFLLIPYNYFSVRNDAKLINDFTQLSHKHHKMIIIFAYGDSDESIDIADSLIFRTSQYSYKKKRNEIIMPGYTEDLADLAKLEIRTKNMKPTIGFCGWAGFKDLKSHIKFSLKNILRTGVMKQGIYYRKKALRALSLSEKINPNFIIRKSYSGHSETIEISPEMARSEYVDNMNNSDFVLTVKGDGNFSYRFYEALSLGRIPLIVNTDCILPLDDIVNYRNFVVSVDYQNLDKMADIVYDYYENLSDAEYAEKQRHARRAFEQYLRIDRYFEIIFKEGKIFDYLKKINHGNKKI